MAVPEHLRGPWVQISHVLRYTKDAPPRTDHESARPRFGGPGNWGDFKDAPDAAYGAMPGPTFVTFDHDDAVDVEALLRQGAIRAPHPRQLPPVHKSKPKPRATVGDEVVEDG